MNGVIKCKECPFFYITMKSEARGDYGICKNVNANWENLLKRNLCFGKNECQLNYESVSHARDDHNKQLINDKIQMKTDDDKIQCKFCNSMLTFADDETKYNCLACGIRLTDYQIMSIKYKRLSERVEKMEDFWKEFTILITSFGRD